MTVTDRPAKFQPTLDEIVLGAWQWIVIAVVATLAIVTIPIWAPLLVLFFRWLDKQDRAELEADGVEWTLLP